MRLFELTIQVYVGDEQELPETFNEWAEQAGFEVPGSSPTRLERIVEVRHPPAGDVIEKRRRKDRRYQ